MLPINKFVAVAAFDFSPLGDRALEEAAGLCDFYPNLELHAVVVGKAEEQLIVMPNVDMAALQLADANDFATRHVAKVIAVLRARGIALQLERIAVYVAVGEPSQTIVELATSIDADRIVLGTHGRDGLKRWILGSVAEEVVRTAACGVHVIRPRDFLAGVLLPEVQPPHQPGEHSLIGAKLLPTYHYVLRHAESSSRIMPVA
jgi:nucleotide-binding universal stress UspA family protein